MTVLRINPYSTYRRGLCIGTPLSDPHGYRKGGCGSTSLGSIDPYPIGVGLNGRVFSRLLLESGQFRDHPNLTRLAGVVSQT